MSFSRRPIVNQFKELVVKTFKIANKSQVYISDIAYGLQSTLDISIMEPTDPALVITKYLLTQLNALKESNAKSSEGSNLIHSFFRKLSVNVHPSTQVQFEEIVKKILERQGDSQIIDNLWKGQTYICYCGSEQARSLDEIKLDSTCYKCRRIFHPQCFWPQDKTQKLFQCPVCYMKNCYPHRPVDQIFFVGRIQYQAREEIEYKIKFQFDINRLNSDNVYIRCVRLNQANRFEITFPQNCRLMISNKILKEFEPLPATSPLKRRNDQEVHVNKYLLSYLTTLYVKQKHNKIQHSPRLQQNHLIMICSVKPPTDFPKQIYDNFKKERLPVKQSKQILQEYMSQSINQCQVEKINVSLQCQYFGTQITCPARSKHCTTHYQPFDLHNFVKLSLTSNNCIQKWRCPICKKRAYDLFVDDYLQSLIKSKGNLKEITFSKNAEPIFIQKQNEIDQQYSEQIARNENNRINNEAIQQQKPQKSVFVIDIEDNTQQKNQREIEQKVATSVQKLNIQKNKPQVPNNIQSVIQIIDSEQNVIREGEQILKRNLQDRIEVQKEGILKSIKKIPPLSQFQADKFQGLKTKIKLSIPQNSNSISERIIQNQNIRAKLKEIFSKDSKKSIKPQQGHNQKKQTNKTEQKINLQIQKNKSNQKTIDPQDKTITILDVDNYEQQRSDKLAAMKQKQIILLSQAKKTLNKEPMTKSDQITFNLICRQIQKLKMK